LTLRTHFERDYYRPKAMAHHPGRALLDSRNSPLAKAVQSLDVARLRELIADGADANTRIGPKSALHELCSTPDVAPLENYEPPRATIMYYIAQGRRFLYYWLLD
jgi:hypothetical protein